MSRSSQRKSSYENSHHYSRSLDDETVSRGASARTRPLSFDEIMLKRKRKKLSEDVKDVAARNAAVAGKITLKSTIEVVGGHLVGDRSEKDDKSWKEEHCEAAETKLKYKSRNDPRPRSRGNERGKVDEKKHFRDPVAVGEDDRYNNDRSRRTSDDGGRKRREQIEDVEKHIIEDSGRRQRHDPEPTERKTKRKIESSYSLREETKLKRRNSRSQEQAKDRRYRRSGSSSPRDHGYVSPRGNEHEQVSLHSHKQHSDADKNNRISSNISGSSHYRSHGRSFSGLGGYSPRKRKTEAAVRTPSPPPKCSPEKKSAASDIAPPVGITSSTIYGRPHLSSLQYKSANVVDSWGVVPVASNVAKSFLALASNSLSFAKNASIDSIQLTQATRPMRRLYIENVPSSASEKDIIERFNNFLLSSGLNHIQGTKPCISCMIHKEKGQALLEFLTPEDASAALAFDGRTLSGYVLKVRRPRDFVDVTTGSLEESKVGAHFVSDSISHSVKDSPHKIFIGGISEALSLEMLLEIVTVFGPLKSIHFEMNRLINEPCAFLEYADQSVTLKACAGLNGIKIGGRVLTVAQAVPNEISMDDSGSTPSYRIPEHVKPLLQKPTPVLKIKNVLNPETMKSLSEAELEEILEDVRLECARFGSVKSVNVIKNNIREILQDSDFPVESIEGDDQDPSACDDMVEANLNPMDERGCSPTYPTSVVEYGGDFADKSPPTDVRGSNTMGCSATGDTISGNRSQTANQESLMKNSLAPYDNKVKVDSNVEKNAVDDDAEDGERVPDLGNNVFELGSVLVEFRRSEASCMAAHCLHGRAFDDRVVMVEYVPQQR